MAWRRWVFPSPAPPWMNNGLYERAGISATASVAAWAKRFEDPVTKASKVYRGSSPTSSDRSPDLELVRRVPATAPADTAGPASELGGTGDRGSSSSMSSANCVGATSTRIFTSWPTASQAAELSRERKRVSTRSRTNVFGALSTSRSPSNDEGERPASQVRQVASET